MKEAAGAKVACISGAGMKSSPITVQAITPGHPLARPALRLAALPQHTQYALVPMLQGFQEHTALRVASYLIVLISIIKTGHAMLLGGAFPMGILAGLWKNPCGCASLGYVNAGYRSIVKTYLAVHEAQLPIAPR